METARPIRATCSVVGCFYRSSEITKSQYPALCRSRGGHPQVRVGASRVRSSLGALWRPLTTKAELPKISVAGSSGQPRSSSVRMSLNRDRTSE